MNLKDFADSLVFEIKGWIADTADGFRKAHDALRETVNSLALSLGAVQTEVAEFKAKLADGSLRGADGANGKDGKDGEPGPQGEKGEPGAAGVAGKDAPTLTPDDVRGQLRELLVGFPEIVGEEVRTWLEANPPADGKDGTDGRDGADGASVSVESVERMVNDRAESLFAKWALEFERRAADTMQKAIDKIPEPRDGKDGRDGRDGKDGKHGLDGKDGFGFDDFEVKYDGERILTFGYERGEERKEFAFIVPVPLYKGVFKEGVAYVTGDLVTWGGHLWHCNEPTDQKPMPTGPKLWTLAAQRGRDGKDAR
jgi:hypothetical protein